MKRAVVSMLLALISAAAVADDSQVPKDTYIGVLGDVLAVPYGSRAPKIDSGLGLDVLLGSREPGQLPFNLGWEFHGFYDTLKVKKPFPEDARRTGFALDATYPFGTIGGFVMPFALAGLGLVYSNDVADHSNEFSVMAEGGGGIVTKPLFSWGWRARADVREVYENYANGYLDTHVYVGIEIPLWGNASVPPPAPEPVKVVEPAPQTEPAAAPVPEAAPQPVDSDGDGVPDASDKCPNTPAGTAVDQDGCPSTVKKVLTLKGVTFEVNSDVLKEASSAALDEAAQTLNNEYPDAKVEVAGHTDSSGKPEHNMELSRRRAESVRKYLVEHGVDAARLTSAGYGDTQPVADNGTKSGKAKNRRVELRIKGAAEAEGTTEGKTAPGH